MNMTNAKSEPLPVPPPRLIGSIRAGFDTAATHIGLIAFPVIVDLILWFGPHFSLRSLLMPVIDNMAKIPGMNAPELSDMLHGMQDMWTSIAQTFNLAAALRTYPVGIPSLEASQLPQHTPFGIPSSISVSSLGAVLGLWVIFSLLGLAGGSLYFQAVSRSISGQTAPRSIHESTWAVFQTILLTLGWICLALLISLPGTLIITVLALFSPTLAQIGTLLIVMVVIWLIVPLLFSPHGIYMFRQNALTSMLTSVRLVRYILPGTGLFFLTVIILSQGLDLLWQVPPDNSWMSLVAIGGHGFITTALLAASFVYYRDATTFVRELVNRASAARQNSI